MVTVAVIKVMIIKSGVGLVVRVSVWCYGKG